MKLFKFYKPDCQPCKFLDSVLRTLDIPQDVEVIPINILEEDNADFVIEFKLSAVPTLVFENGYRHQGMMPSHEFQTWLNTHGERLR